jgi:hypothetical protein
MVQIDGPKRRVYIKLATSEQMQSLFHSTDRHMDYRHDNGELSSVQVQLAGMALDVSGLHTYRQRYLAG